MESKIGNNTMYLVEDITRRLNGEKKVRTINCNKITNRSMTSYLLKPALSCLKSTMKTKDV